METGESKNLPIALAVEEPEIVSAAAHKKFLKLRANPIFDREARFFPTSNPNVVIDPLNTLERIEEDMKPLPRKERDSIFDQVRGYKVAVNKLEELKSKAFGFQVAVTDESLSKFTANKIFDERTAELITLFGKMYNLKEVHEIVSIDWGYPITKKALSTFKERHASKISEERLIWQHDLSHLQLAHKPARIELMTQAVRKYEREWKKTGSEKAYNNMLKAFDRIQKDVSKTEIDLNANINHSFEKLIQPHIATEILGGMSLNEIIVCRVARQLEVSPLYIVQKLQDSFYAKFTSFGDTTNSEEIKGMVPDSPHLVTYDWEKLSDLDASGEMDEANLLALKYEPIIEDKPVDIDVRALVKRKLAERKNNKQ
jgi:hypothetical protein